MIKDKKEAKAKEKNDRIPYFEIEASGGISGCSILVSGCVKIAEFSPDKTVLSLKSGALIIEGNSLKISVFENKDLQISGKIENIHIEYKKMRRSFYES